MTVNKIYRPSLWFQLILASVVGILVYNTAVHAEDAEAWMPDPALRETVREKLEIPDGIPMLPEDMVELRDLVTEGDIESLKGLEYAINLEFLHIKSNGMRYVPRIQIYFFLSQCGTILPKPASIQRILLIG